MNSIGCVGRGQSQRQRSPWRTLAIAIALFSCVSAFALDPDRTLGQYICRVWNAQNGFPSYEISSIKQTRDGFIWIGTRKGLIRYDGLEFKLLPLPVTRAFQYSEISALACSADDGLWLGIRNGTFAYYRSDKGFLAFTNEPWIEPRMNVRELLETSDGALWIGSTAGAFRWMRGGKVSAFPEILECGSILEDSHKRVWLGSLGSQLYCWSNGELGPDLQPSMTNHSARAIAEDPLGQIWIGSPDRLECFDVSRRSQGDSGFAGSVTKLLIDSHGVLWVGTSEGLYRAENGSFASLRRTDGLADDYVTALFEDRGGNLWVGGRTGLSMLSDVKLPLFSQSEGLWQAWNLSVCASKNGGLWAGTSGGLGYYDGKLSQIKSKDAGLSANWVKRVYEAQNGDVYLLNGNREVEIFRAGKVIARHTWKSEWPTALTEDPQGMIVSFSGSLCRVSVDKIEPYDFGTNAHPKFDWINNLGNTRDGSILVATVNGMFRVKDTQYQKTDLENGLPSRSVLWLSEDEPGVIWAGTAGGLARIKGTTVRSWTRDDGLVDNFIRSVIPDNHDRLWIQSNQGIFSVKKSTLEETGEVECVAYDGPDSVKTTDTREVEYSACRTTDGRLWFPSPQGLIMVDPARVFSDSNAPPVHIETVRINGKAYSRPGRIVSPPGKGELEVQYTAPTFIVPERQQFRYQLDGYEFQWREAGPRRSAFYTNLRPGKYRFLVQAWNAEAHSGGSVASLEVELLPFFYQTTWFYALCAAAVMMALAAGYAWRASLLRRKHQAMQAAQDRLESEVQHRTSELKERTLSLEKEIEERERMQLEIERVHRKLVEASRLAGMAEVATGVLHNVGNVLNSVNVSTSVLAERTRKSRITLVGKAAAMLKEHEADLGRFMTSDPKGRQLPGFLAGLAERLACDQAEALEELDSLQKHVDHIKEIVAMQQSHAKVTGVTTVENVVELVEDALRIDAAALERHRVALVRDFDAGLPPIVVDRHKVMQIILNLMSNAKHACLESTRDHKQVTVRLSSLNERIAISVMDNGVGIAPENLARIFSHGFTTRKDGHGFGLHSGALAAKEMGGQLRVASPGPGEGATFVLELPLQPPATPNASDDALNSSG